MHAILIAGVIGSAVGNDLVLAHPHASPHTAQILTLVAGPVVYLLGSAAYKNAVYGRLPASYLAGALALLVLISVGYASDMLTMGWLTTAVLLLVSFWESRRPAKVNAVNLTASAWPRE